MSACTAIPTKSLSWLNCRAHLLKRLDKLVAGFMGDIGVHMRVRPHRQWLPLNLKNL